jgi:hypothetical protein
MYPALSIVYSPCFIPCALITVSWGQHYNCKHRANCPININYPYLSDGYNFTPQSGHTRESLQGGSFFLPEAAIAAQIRQKRFVKPAKTSKICQIIAAAIIAPTAYF